VSLKINVFELASIGALLCSSDVISTLSQVSFEMQPNIYSVIYGEGIFNNLVSIVLVECIDEQLKNDFSDKDKVDWVSIFSMVWRFVGYISISIAIGFLSGCLSSLLFKYVRCINGSPAIETVLIFVWAIITYHITEIMTFTSGVVCLFTCGMTMGHYTWYNLSS